MEKKVLFIINHYSANSDQHLYHTLNLMKTLGEKGIKVAVIFERVEGKLPYIHENVTVYGQKQKNKFLRIAELCFLVRKIIQNGYKKVFVRITFHSAIIASICGKIYGADTYYWHSGSGFDFMEEMPEFRRKDMERSRKTIKIIGKMVDYFVTGPESMIAYYHKWCDVPEDKLLLLYNDIDTNRFKPADNVEKMGLREALNLSKDKFYVLFVHRFSGLRRTGYYIPYCLEGMDNNVEFIFIGDGPEENEVKKATQDAGVKNVHFLGSLPNAMIQKYYRACDVFMNPTFGEGFPRVIIEAMGCGLPIVTTNAGGTSDLFEEYQQQFISDVRDREQLKESLERMIIDSSSRERCIEENLERVKRYSTETVADMYINMFWATKK